MYIKKSLQNHGNGFFETVGIKVYVEFKLHTSKYRFVKFIEGDYDCSLSFNFIQFKSIIVQFNVTWIPMPFASDLTACPTINVFF